MTLAQIAEKRSLVRATIEGHMAHWVAKGKVDIDRLVTNEKRQAIEQELTRRQGQSFSAVKQALGNHFSYGEIRLVQAHLKQDADSADP